MTGERYTDEEIKLLRKQLREGNKRARAAVKKRGVKLHPRIAAMRASSSSSRATETKA